MSEETQEKNYDELLATARKRFEQDMSDEREIRDEAEKDLRFEAGDQWDETVKANRLKAGRPALTFNRTHTFVQQVSNEARQNKVQIKYIPGEDGDKEEAQIYEGLARYIQSTVEAEEATETAAEYAAAGGFGFFGYTTEYCNDDSDYQDVKLRCFPDPFQVYGLLLPYIYGEEPDHCFIVTKLSKEEYKQQFPDSEAADLNWATEGDRYSGWIEDDKIRIAEYWVLEKKPRKGKPGRYDRKVKVYKINGHEVLEENEWGGKQIPHVAVLGKARIIDGKPRLYSVIRFQRDPQQLVNFYKTRIAETLGTAPIQPYMVAEGQIPQHLRAQWEQMNTTQRPYLEYANVNVAGQPVPPPQRQTFEPPIASLSAAAAQEIDDMKAAAGIFDPSLGAKAAATSGIAKARDQQQAAITNMHFPDNVARALKKAGAILRELIPVYYQEKRVVQILGADETAQTVPINMPTKGRDGSEKTYRFGPDAMANYNVIVDVGKAFSTKRMESFDMMTQVLQSSPNMLPMIGDIFFKNSDMAGSDQLAERFKKMLPPNLQDQQEGQMEIPPQVQAQVAQMQQAHQQLNAYAQQLEQENQQYKVGFQAKQMEIESRENIEKMKIEAQITIAEITTKAQSELQRMKFEHDLATKLQVQDDAQAHEGALEAAKAQHEINMAQMGHEQNMEAQQAQVEGQSQLQDQSAQAAMEQQRMAQENSQED